ncbi:unnamed protein product [Nesidiocoris tenuis]|uniref:Uncharacterized protein n=1 Tax=Nesidiocoris tenuis TaxID=355587 RepID=A0A6H5GLQ4_9HEMI|nr:unnamed protein product [Nesidiocoris tenuis]
MAASNKEDCKNVEKLMARSSLYPKTADDHENVEASTVLQFVPNSNFQNPEPAQQAKEVVAGFEICPWRVCTRFLHLCHCPSKPFTDVRSWKPPAEQRKQWKSVLSELPHDKFPTRTKLCGNKGELYLEIF